MKKIDGREDLTDQQFGRWSVLEMDVRSGRDYGKYSAICECVCGTIRPVRVDQLKNGHSLSCGCIVLEPRPQISGNKNPAWKGAGNLSGRRWADIRRGASRRDLAFEISKEYAWNVFEQQNGKCALTGQELDFNPHSFGTQTASIDRIDNQRGYEVGNIQWIHKDVNKMRGQMSLEEFLFWCRLVARTHGSN